MRNLRRDRMTEEVLDPGAIHASGEHRIPVVRHHHDAFGIHLQDADHRHDQAGVLYRGDAEVGDQDDVVRVLERLQGDLESWEVVSATTSSNVERNSATSERRCAVVT